MIKRKILYNVLFVFVIIMVLGGIVSRQALALDKMTMQILDKRFDDVPFVLENDEILAPARSVVEGFDGEIEWFGLLKVLNFKFDREYQIRMQINNPIVSINPGKQDTISGIYDERLSVVPQIIEGQTMIPLNFFAQHFGLLLKWDDEKKIAKVYKPSNWVRDLSYEESLTGETLVITSTKKIPFTSHVLSAPDRLVIDLEESALAAKVTSLLEETYAFKSVKIAQHDTETVRIVMEFNNLVKYDISEEMGSEGFILKVAFAPGIREVELKKQGISIKSTGEIRDYKILELTNPHRLVIDLMDQTLQLSEKTISITHSLIKKVRASQMSWEPQVARLVLDLSDKIEYNILRGETAKEIIVKVKESGNTEDFPEEKPFQTPDELDDTKKNTEDGIDIVLLDVGEEYSDNELVSIGIMEGVNQRIVIKTSTPITYNAWYLPNPDRLIVDLFGAISKLQTDQILSEKGIIKNIRMHQYPDKVRIVFDLTQYVSHQVISEKRSQKIEVGLGQNPLFGKLIVLDPGHGGIDPGAVSANGKFEKDITLDIGMKTKELLKSMGATVIMTRDKDVYPTLGERVDLANQLNAEIFISIHCNSFVGDEPGGTETFISASRQGGSSQLAQAIQIQLINQIQLYDRGVKSSNFYVLNHTTMPAALVEVAFLSKKEEEALLVDEDFRQKAAQGIYEGILDYFIQIFESGEDQ
ncbi:MAG: N-acetylmuramoyl-L-alanine amidase [Halanaerobiales bacterium]|nr:N-acetylmuramoyl-L-alanine amidase [Halanaerobiales bacterium]